MERGTKEILMLRPSAWRKFSSQLTFWDFSHDIFVPFNSIYYMIKLYLLPNSELMLAKEKLLKSCHFREYLLEPRLFVDQTGTGVIRTEAKVIRTKIVRLYNIN